MPGGTIADALEKLIAEDRAAGRAPGERLRVGFYSFHEPLADATPAAEPTMPAINPPANPADPPPPGSPQPR